MPVNADPLASLATWPVDLTIGDKTYTIPPKSAAYWLIALLEEFGSLEPIIELLPLESKAEIEQATIDGSIDSGEREQAFRDAIEAIAGRPWWVVINYLNLARGYWARFHGRVLSSGLNPEEVSFGAYLDAIHYAFIEGRDEQNAQKILNFLETPPPGVAIELDQETESQTFLAMLNQAR